MKKLLFSILLSGVLLTGIFALPVLAAPVMPSGETHYATFITQTTATLNGYVIDDGGEPCEVRFQYYIDGGTWTDHTTTYVAGYVTGDSIAVDITGLTDGGLYYCRVQVKNSAGTFTGSGETFTAYAAPEMPSTWFATPDYTRFRHAFFYGMYNFIADRTQIPRATFYMLATILDCIILAIIALIIGRRLMPVLITLGGSMALGALLRLLPMFFIAFTILAVWGMMKMGHPTPED